MTEKKTLSMEDIVTESRLGRRATIGSVGLGIAALASVGIASSASAQEAEPLCSDSDPYDPGGRGRHCGSYGGCSDSDPYDPGGRGRHCGGGYSGCSDADPYDPGGGGRSCYRSCSDSDPYDPGGHGRHC
jgi:hypothetical protein